jgi:signal peptidase I
MNTPPDSAIRSCRTAVDLAVAFVVAVILLRTFVLEGYLISTGSMAPGLCGFHRQVHCPSCQFVFAFGVAFDESTPGSPGTIQEPTGPRRLATCPNCGQSGIDVSNLPNNHGDQLLVHKHIFDIRPPRRWETVVFRNPASPGEAFVKRVVGLPGETIRIKAGDVHINGQIARKPLSAQLDLRIPVCSLRMPDSDHPEWQLPWDLDQHWKVQQNTLLLSTPPAETQSPAAAQTTEPAWIRFHYWKPSGGRHPAETPLARSAAEPDWSDFLSRFRDVPIAWSAQLHYDSEREVLQCEGVMPAELQRDLVRNATSSEFRNAVFRLAALSHLAPVTDRYGYNSLVASPEYVVSDLMLDTSIQWQQPPARIHVRIPVGNETFGLTLDTSNHSATLLSIDQQTVLQQGTFATGDGQSVHIIASSFDQQIAISINGTAPFPDFPVAAAQPPDEPVEAAAAPIGEHRPDPAHAASISLLIERQKRWALGISGGSAIVNRLNMYRDVFYTPGRRRNAIKNDYTIPENCYFVQGDNSPVSSDSRNWEKPVVPHAFLVGKPFLVHLPSKPAILQFAGREWRIRIPDWERIRYIH